MDRVAIFVDGAYFDKLLELEFDRARVDFGKLAEYIADQDPILRTYYYHCPPYVSPNPTDSEIYRKESKDKFFNALSSLPRFQVRLGRLIYRGNDSNGKPIFLQKLVDIMLGVDLVKLSATRQISKAVLVAGDYDFYPAVEAAKDQGVIVSLWHGPHADRQSGTRGTVNRDLWELCDDRHEITQDVIDEVLREDPRYRD